MKILYVQDTDWIRRNPIHQNHLIERMILRGHEIKVIDYEILWRVEGKKELLSKKKIFHIARLLNKAEHEVIRPGILKIPLLDYVSMIFTYRKEINNLLKEFQPDIIIGDGILTPLLAFHLGKKPNVKKVYFCIDVDYKLIKFRLLQPFGRIIESHNMKMADLVISISNVLCEYTIQMGVNSKKTKVIKSGIDLNLFNLNSDGNEIRKKFEIEKNEILLIFVGWLYHFSGLKEVALSLKNLQRNDIKLLIIGDGDAFSDLQKYIEKYNMQNKIIMLGRMPYISVPKYIAAADICILPAYNNKTMRYIVPIKMYEYMAMEKPIIATKLPGIVKEFGFGNGVIYIDKSIDVISRVIELINKGKIHLEGKKARNFVENNDWETVTDDFEKTLEGLLLLNN